MGFLLRMVRLFGDRGHLSFGRDFRFPNSVQASWHPDLEAGGNPSHGAAGTVGTMVKYLISGIF